MKASPRDEFVDRPLHARDAQESLNILNGAREMEIAIVQSVRAERSE